MVTSMSSSHFFRLGKVNKQKLLIALKHNKRETQEKRDADAHIDVARSHLNYSLTGEGDAKSIETYAKIQLVRAGIDKPRKNAVMAVEVMFSLPIERHNQDTRQFFIDCCEWATKIFAGELLAFDVHLDESAPHAHALILPLVDGKMQGSDMVGGIGNLNRLRNLFYADVARHYGLGRNSTKRLNQADKESLAQDVLSALKSDSVMSSAVWPVVREHIASNPLSYAELLSIASPAKRTKHFVDIARSRGRGSFVT